MLPLLRFSPVLKRARWGGRRLASLLQKQIGPESDYAESWELVDLNQNQSHCLKALPARQTLHDFVTGHPVELFGDHSRSHPGFPLLIKFLDAHDCLSVQVHPNDHQAAQHNPGEMGKTEAWHILDADPDSVIYMGVKPGTTLETLRHALTLGEPVNLLNRIPVKRGETFLIPAGTIHAVGKGVLLLEIQQSSDITYRLYDWGWVDAQGRPRPLQIEQGLSCLDLSLPEQKHIAPKILATHPFCCERLLSCEYFNLRRSLYPSGMWTEADDRLRIWTVIGGTGKAEAQGHSEHLATGDTLLIPAATRMVRITAQDQLEIIETRIGAES